MAIFCDGVRRGLQWGDDFINFILVKWSDATDADFQVSDAITQTWLD